MSAGAAASPWSNVKSSASCSLNDVMSEQLAQDLETKEHGQISKGFALEFDPSDVMLRDEPDASDDLLLAQMLQHEFDKEHDYDIKLRENKHNGDSKVRIVYDNYRNVHPDMWDEEFEDDEVVEKEEEKEQCRNFRGRGISGKGKDIATKHDEGISQRRNGTKAMEQIPLEVRVGDGQDMRLSDRVFNKLKQYSLSAAKRTQRLHEKKDHSTAEHSMDANTRLLLYKLMNAGVLEDVNGVISTGKESVVFHATGASGGLIPMDDEGRRFEVPPKEVAIKAFKTTLTDFKNRSDYVKGDVRFFKDEFKKRNPRKIMRLWAEKESINLRRMARFGVRCPRFLQVRKHVLLMSFIGRDRRAAPKLRDAKLSTAQAELAYQDVVETICKMYRECYLVHGDLSEYNLLWHDDHVYVIDVSQAVDRHHPHAHEFLLRDCRNVAQFFRKLGVHDTMNEYKLFNHITGLNLTGSGKQFLMQIEDYEKNENRLRLGTNQKDFNFDFFFDHVSKATNCRADSSEDADESQSAQNRGVSERLCAEEDSEESGEVAERLGTQLDAEEIDYSSSEGEDEDEKGEALFEDYIQTRRVRIAEEILTQEDSLGDVISKETIEDS